MLIVSVSSSLSSRYVAFGLWVVVLVEMVNGEKKVVAVSVELRLVEVGCGVNGDWSLVVVCEFVPLVVCLGVTSLVTPGSLVILFGVMVEYVVSVGD